MIVKSHLLMFYRRSREGAWIEIISAPKESYGVICRSREGAWIEITVSNLVLSSLDISRSREGAWIEIKYPPGCTLCRYRRSREGAWIEIMQCW